MAATPGVDRRLAAAADWSRCAAWKARIRRHHFANEASLRSWLTDQEVTGYPQQLLVMETFGYPEFLLASARSST